MPNGMRGGVRGRKAKVGRKLLRFPPTRFLLLVIYWDKRKRGQSEKDIFGAPGKHQKFRIGSGGIGETQKQDCQNHKSTVG